MLEHFVVFACKPGQEEVLDRALQEFDDGIRGLPVLLELTWGRNVSPRALELGYTHGLLARLTDIDTFRDEYWNHEAHVRLLPVLDACCETRYAIDYEVAGAAAD